MIVVWKVISIAIVLTVVVITVTAIVIVLGKMTLGGTY